ncbi:MAG: MgtC/SapB family protein [Planctomycetota bacterium JB042]
MPTPDPIDWSLLVTNGVKLFAAYLLAVPTAWDRESRHRPAGLRTFPLVSIAACGYVLVGRDVFGTDGQALARIVQGLMTGIGFVGGGAIVKSKVSVEGTATASGIWCTGAIGCSVALERYEIALLLSAIVFLTFRYVTELKSAVPSTDSGAGDDRSE